MPELPEVETIRRDLEKKILNKKISKIKVIDPKIKKIGTLLPVNFLIGHKIKKADRIGKLLIFCLDTGYFLLVHLKMTGQLIYQNKKETISGGHKTKISFVFPKKGKNKYTRLIVYFQDGAKLFFNDLRKFGYARIVNKKELDKIKRGFGPEPGKNNFTLKNFQKIFRNKKTSVKAVLLNQKNVAGIGNIYADEILFASKIMPGRKANLLLKKEIANIFKNTQKIIKKAVKWRGTTFGDYVDGRGQKGNFSRFLEIYGREEKKCRVCGKKIKKIKLAGRGTRFCPECQKN